MPGVSHWFKCGRFVSKISNRFLYSRWISDAASVVFDKCTVDSRSSVQGIKTHKIYFDYEFLDDTYTIPVHQGVVKCKS